MKKVMSNLEVIIKDFRAIKQADISLDGITVLAGVNGSGKSTVSKLVYYILKGMKDYDKLVMSNLNSKLGSFESVLLNMMRSSALLYHNYGKFARMMRIYDAEDIDMLSDSFSSLCAFLDENFDRSSPSFDRYRRMIINTIGGSEILSFEDALLRLNEMAQREIHKAKDRLHSRPPKLLHNDLDFHFGERVVDMVSIKEYGEDLYSNTISTVQIPHFVNNLFYIDTPFAIGDADLSFWDDSSHWNDLNKALKQIDGIKYSTIASLIERKVIKGSARYEDNDSISDYIFKDNHGREFSLSRAATGIKSFAILQMLLRGGYIKEDTLLILDEPEAHLHPQWIIEYARVIVLIHKTIGAKFLISSHNPDMVGALRYISETEKCLDALSFYNAVSSRGGTGQYSFKPIGLDIEPIFKSFNQSFEKLNKYTGNNGEE